jgi:RNase H-fold protein (predicted Holliday junction resolvase)
MTNFDGYVGEGEYNPNGETTEILTYCVGAVLVFSVAFAVVRRQYNSVNQRTNITKAIKKRFRNIVGSDPNNFNNAASNRDQRDRFLNEERKQRHDIERNYQEEEKKSHEAFDPIKDRESKNKKMVDKIVNGLGFLSNKKEKPGDYISMDN